MKERLRGKGDGVLLRRGGDICIGDRLRLGGEGERPRPGERLCLSGGERLLGDRDLRRLGGGTGEGDLLMFLPNILLCLGETDHLEPPLDGCFLEDLFG